MDLRFRRPGVPMERLQCIGHELKNRVDEARTQKERVGEYLRMHSLASRMISELNTEAWVRHPEQAHDDGPRADMPFFLHMKARVSDLEIGLNPFASGYSQLITDGAPEDICSMENYYILMARGIASSDFSERGFASRAQLMFEDGLSNIKSLKQFARGVRTPFFFDPYSRVSVQCPSPRSIAYQATGFAAFGAGGVGIMTHNIHDILSLRGVRGAAMGVVFGLVCGASSYLGAKARYHDAVRSAIDTVLGLDKIAKDYDRLLDVMSIYAEETRCLVTAITPYMSFRTLEGLQREA